jgi:MoaA/NifB/PqqE/SkfB family radical SAM enzyme
MNMSEEQRTNQEPLILDGCKIVYHKERIESWARGEKIAPITIDCSLTTQCSYRCVYCYGKMQCINQHPHLDRETIFNFLDDAAEIGVKAVSFVSDGESTCNPHLKEAIIRGKHNGLDMALGTNGYLLKDEDLEDILPRLTYLRFNISAGERERYAYIHGCSGKCYDKVISTIRKAVEVKNKLHLDVTIGLQMVLLPEFKDQIIPLTLLGKKLEVDYLVIKHCSDDEDGTLGVDYTKYHDMIDILKEAETYSSPEYKVTVKWSKVLSNGQKVYTKCFGPQFILQLSGSGLVAPCGMLFNEKYNEYHMGNIRDTRFKDIWASDRYWEIMHKIASDGFNPQTDCGTLCLQHKTNEVLWDVRQSKQIPQAPGDQVPMHINFI